MSIAILIILVILLILFILYNMTDYNVNLHDFIIGVIVLLIFLSITNIVHEGRWGTVFNNHHESVLTIHSESTITDSLSRFKCRWYNTRLGRRGKDLIFIAPSDNFNPGDTIEFIKK